LVIERIASTLDGKADVVLCDGAPDVLDLGDVDAHLQLSLCRAALACARKVLAQGGSFVCKIYRGRGAAAFFDELRREFADVLCAKPRCSRHASVEAYAVGRGFGRASDATGPVPFVACGGADAFDADASYALEEDYVYRDPVQAPLRPPHLVGVPTPPPAPTARRAAPAVAARPPRRREALACEGAPPPASDAGGLGAWFL
jgi:tRNA (cytidine32/guanosine34-2'-O)-methyltransferase